MLCLGLIYLVLGLLIDLGVPIYIGTVTDSIQQGNVQTLIPYTVIILLIIGVSIEVIV